MHNNSHMENTPSSLPENFQEASTYFSDPATAFACVMSFVWPDGVTCPHCGSKENTIIRTRNVWRCKGCSKQFSVKVATIMEDSPLSLDLWLRGLWLVANSKKGISSYEIHRKLGITQKSSWFMLRRIRLAINARSPHEKRSEPVAGTVPRIAVPDVRVSEKSQVENVRGWRSW